MYFQAKIRDYVIFVRAVQLSFFEAKNNKLNNIIVCILSI